MLPSWQEHVQLPEWATDYRPDQIEAIEGLLEGFETNKVMLLDAPTGAGKTLIGDVMRQIASARWKATQGLYVCTTKTLQEQVTHDFPNADLIKGRANYATYDEEDRFDALGARHLDASMCTKKGIDSTQLPLCDLCTTSQPDLSYNPMGGAHESRTVLHCFNCHPWQYCHYEQAKNAALTSPFAVANTAYFLTESNMVGRFGVQDDGSHTFPFVIIDEADTLESVLMSFVELTIPRRAIQDLGLGLPSRKTKPEWWLEWAERAKQKVKGRCATLAGELGAFHDSPPPLALQKESDRWQRYLGQLEVVVHDLARQPDNWVIDGLDEGYVELKPVEISSYAQNLIWRHSRRFLLMSATVISAKQMAQDLGLADHEWGSVEVDSNFPISRRPVYVTPVASVSYKTKDTDWPLIGDGIIDILDNHLHERVLVHTVSYPMTSFLDDYLRSSVHSSRVISYSNSATRDGAVEMYRSHEGSVLLAPSLDRGIDLPDDMCRVIIIAKVPFPNLGDKQVKKRFYGTYTGKGWFYMQTIRSIVQMSGRGMRHRDDSVTTYILDGQFVNNVWPSPFGRSRIPKWWANALVWPAPKRRER